MDTALYVLYTAKNHNYSSKKKREKEKEKERKRKKEKKKRFKTAAKLTIFASAIIWKTTFHIWFIIVDYEYIYLIENKIWIFFLFLRDFGARTPPLLI